MSFIGVMCSRQSLRLGKGIQQFRLPPAKWLTTTASVGSHKPLNPDEGFWEKNSRLKRPMSPHLTIYRPQITSILSVTHRGTGLALSALMSGFAIGMLALPNGFPHYYGILSSTLGGSLIILASKFLLAFPFFFHLFNGLRHLAWDIGKGFELRDLYLSGYSVLGASLFLALVAAAL